MGLTLCSELLKNKPTFAELKLIGEIEAKATPGAPDEKKWEMVTEELLKTARGENIVKKLSDVDDWKTVVFDIVVVNEVFCLFEEGVFNSI